MRNSPRWIAFAAFALVGASGSPISLWAQEVEEAGPEVEATEAAEKQEIRIQIDNQNMLELHVYVVTGPIGSPLTSRISLGTVYAQGSKTFKLSDSLVAHDGREFRILVRPMGTHRFLASEHIVIGKSGTVKWTLIRPLSSGGYISVTE